jgi:hypothetical protein
MAKPTNEELKVRAYAMAEAFYYSDDECEIAWEPFEHWDDEEIHAELRNMANHIYIALVWAQGDDE